MQAPRPAVLGQDAHDLLELGFHLWRHVGPRLAEILEVGGREHQHLAGAVVAEIVAALLVLRRLGPVEEVGFLALRLLREQIVGQPDRQLAVVGELLDDGIILRIVLKAAAGIDRAGDAEPVQFAHEMACGVDLVVERQLWAAGQRRVENRRIRFGEQQPGRIALARRARSRRPADRACPWCSRPRAAPPHSEWRGRRDAEGRPACPARPH